MKGVFFFFSDVSEPLLIFQMSYINFSARYENLSDYLKVTVECFLVSGIVICNTTADVI